MTALVFGLWLLTQALPADLEAFGDWAVLVHGSGRLEAVDTLGRTLWWRQVDDLVDVEGGPLLLYVLRSDRLEVYGADGTLVSQVPVQARACGVIFDGTVFLLSPDGTEVQRLQGQRLEPAFPLPRPALGLEGAGLALAVRFPDAVWVLDPNGTLWWKGTARVRRVFAQRPQVFWVQRADTLYLPPGTAVGGIARFDLSPAPDLRLWILESSGTLKVLRISNFPEP